MDKRTAKKVTSGVRVRENSNMIRGVGHVEEIDEGPGSDPRVKYPLFNVRWSDGEAFWITYRLLKLCDPEPRVGDTITRAGVKSVVLERTRGPTWQLRVSSLGNGSEHWIVDAWFHFKSGTLVVEEG